MFFRRKIALGAFCLRIWCRFKGLGSGAIGSLAKITYVRGCTLSISSTDRDTLRTLTLSSFTHTLPHTSPPLSILSTSVHFLTTEPFRPLSAVPTKLQSQSSNGPVITPRLSFSGAASTTSVFVSLAPSSG